jgi:hypothetical protein
MYLEILFALFILLTLGIALFRRKKENKTWVAEERYEESGAWLDKRASDRGTYGSLDREMEDARKSVLREGQAAELAQLLRDYAFEHLPGFHERSDEQLRAFSKAAKLQSAWYIGQLEQILNDHWPNLSEPPTEAAAPPAELKKTVLDFAYRQFPKLLDLEIEQLRRLDVFTAEWAQKMLQR